MKERQYSWRSYIALTMSLLVLISWGLLYLIDNVFGGSYANVFVYLIIFGLLLAVLFAGISWLSPLEKKKIAIIVLIIVLVISLAVIGFAFWLVWDAIE